jgi:hypothetical protein
VAGRGERHSSGALSAEAIAPLRSGGKGAARSVSCGDPAQHHGCDQRRQSRPRNCLARGTGAARAGEQPHSTPEDPEAPKPLKELRANWNRSLPKQERERLDRARPVHKAFDELLAKIRLRSPSAAAWTMRWP